MLDDCFRWYSGHRASPGAGYSGFAVKGGLRNDNPVAGIDAYELGTRHTWTDEQLAAYEACWPLGTRERLAFATLLYSGQRGGDVVKLMRPDAKARFLTLTQEKTGTYLTIPIHPEWRNAINAGPSKGLSLIGDHRGRPIKRPMLTLIIQVAARKAGLPPECKAHGLRRFCGGIGRSRKVLKTDCRHERSQVVEGNRALHRQGRPGQTGRGRDV